MTKSNMCSTRKAHQRVRLTNSLVSRLERGAVKTSANALASASVGLAANPASAVWLGTNASDAARAIGELGVGLEDAEYVGGVLWTGLTDKEAKGNPEEQKRVVVDRLTRWATRDGADGSAVAAAVRAVPDEYLPGPVAARAPQPGPRSRVRAVRGPAAPRPGESGTAGGPYADRASRTGPADADGRDGTAPPPAAGLCPRTHAPGQADTRTRTGVRAAVPCERATASARQPAKAETPGRALARPGLSGSSVIVSPLAAAGHHRREHASRLRRRHAVGWLPGIKYLAGREPANPFLCSVMNSRVQAGIAVAGLAHL